ncbi:MAG: AtpZ/AtpI family protein [Candidatus Binatia bacterium]
MNVDRDFLIRYGRLTALGFQIAGSIVGGLVLGSYADEYFNTKPWLTLLFTVGGFFGAMRLLLWTLKRPNDRRIP